METNITDDFFVKGRLNPIPEINYQTVLHFKNGEKYVRAFDLIYSNEKIKRIFFAQPILCGKSFDIEKLFIGRLLDELTGSAERKNTPIQKKPKSKKRKVDETARETAAKNLFTDLGL